MDKKILKFILGYVCVAWPFAFIAFAFAFATSPQPSDIGYCNLVDIPPGHLFRHDTNVYMRCVPEPNGRIVERGQPDPDDQHAHLLLAGKGAVLCVRVSDTPGGRFSDGTRGGLIVLPETTYVQRVD